MKIEDMIKDIFKKAYDIFANHFVALIIGTLIAIIGMIFVITIPPLIFGLYIMCVELVKGNKVEWNTVFQGFNYFFVSWGIFILAILAVAVGLALLVIPGILLMILLQYVIAVELLEKKGVIASLKRSYQIGKDNFTFSIVFFILMAVLNSLGSLTKIGILITLPFTLICTVIATQKISGKAPAKKKAKK